MKRYNNYTNQLYEEYCGFSLSNNKESGILSDKDVNDNKNEPTTSSVDILLKQIKNLKIISE